jgi:hypothetical protein
MPAAYPVQLKMRTHEAGLRVHPMGEGVHALKSLRSVPGTMILSSVSLID